MKKILNNTVWLENRYNFLKSFIKLIGEKDITETVNNKVISLEIFKNFMNAISNGIIDNNNIKEANNKYFSDIEKYLAKSKSNKNVDQLKNYLIRITNLVNKNDKKKLQSTDTDREYDTDILPLETEEESAEKIANIYESRDDTRKKEKSDFNEYGIDINGLNRDGYNINGIDENGLDRDGYNINRVGRNGIDGDGYNINGIEGTIKKYPKRKVNWRDDDDVLYDQYGFNSARFNKDGYDIYGFDIDGLNKDGLNKFGYKKKSGKDLNISALHILLSKIYTNNSSKEIIVKTYTTINKF